VHVPPVKWASILCADESMHPRSLRREWNMLLSAQPGAHLAYSYANDPSTRHAAIRSV